MKIRLFFAPWEYQCEDLGTYPLGIAYLGAVLEKAGYDTKGFNLGYKKWEDAKESVRNIIKEDKPDIIGLTVLTNNRTSSFNLFKLIKEINPKIITIAGGVHVTFMYKQVLENYPQVDYIVLGEGEQTIIELVKAIKNKSGLKELKRIKGIAFKHNGEVIVTGRRERIKDLNSLPEPKHEYFEDQINKTGTVYIMSSRGCPFNCEFCPSSPFWGQFVARRNPKNIFKEIMNLNKKFPNLKLIIFGDDEFICDNKNVIELCKLMIKNNFKKKWICAGGRTTSINEELLSWMKKAGCTTIGIGIESGSQELLDKMNKKQTIPQIIRAVNICKKQGIKPDPLLFIGFPGETNKSINQTISLLKKLRLEDSPGFLILPPGTGVYETAKKK